MKHKIRCAYGYTDEQIHAEIGTHGSDWAVDAYKMIMEDEERHWQMMSSVLPTARTAMDKKSGKALARYSKELKKNITKIFAPWIEEERIERIRKRLSRPPEGVVYNEKGKVIDLDDPEWWKKA